MEIVPLHWFWVILTTVITIIVAQLYFKPKTVPKFISEATLYGKISNGQKYKFVKVIQVPKRWFTHFYAFAVFCNTIFLAVVIRVYILHSNVPDWVVAILDFLVPTREVSTDHLAALLCMILIWLHTFRRLSECLFVSVYSKSTMNIIHYIIGYLFYFGVTTTLLSESPDFTLKTFQGRTATVSNYTFTWNKGVGLLLYIFGTVMHNQAHVTFANLRKKSGKVVTTAHSIPTGFWFKYVSCPHYLAEILIYIALLTILGFRHFGWWLLLSWVVFSQMFSAGLTHQWYKKKYKEYPKNRKALIPFVW